jgi:chorismate mutase-like protein
MSAPGSSAGWGSDGAEPSDEIDADTDDPIAALAELRQRIDQLDHRLVEVLAERVAICEEVARVKELTDMAVIQPTRVRDVLTSRRQWAIDAGADPDFVEQVMRVLLAETHRIEVAGRRPDPAPDKPAAPGMDRSLLDTVAARIDHMVVTVNDLAAATAFFEDRLGFHIEPLAGGDANGICSLTAGGVTVVLVGRDASEAVGRYVDDSGFGVQHIAIEVLNAALARASLASNDTPLLTEVVVDDHGHEQFFTVRDEASGLQLGFLSRTGHRVGVSAANVLALFEELDRPR